MDLGNTLPYIRAGKLRALAVCSEERNPPPGTPSSIADKLSATIAEALQNPEVVKQFDLGLEVTGSTSAAMTLFMRQERERWANIIRITGATAE